MMDRHLRTEWDTKHRWMGVAAILFICLSPLAYYSCSSIDCPIENTVSVQYEIRDKEGNALAITDSLSVVTTRIDNNDIFLQMSVRESDKITFLNKLVGRSAFSLPISYSHPEDVLYFCFTDNDTTIVDTVWIKKDDIPHFESVDCSAAFFHELTNVRHTHNVIDSLVLVNRSVNYDYKTVHFYLYPNTDD